MAIKIICYKCPQNVFLKFCFIFRGVQIIAGFEFGKAI